MTDTDKMTADEAINEYYKLKSFYEVEYRKKYIEPIISSTGTKKEKRSKYSKLPKPECVNCKRQVGTLFNAKYDEDELFKLYTVKCGDISNPCPLNINIKSVKKLNLDEEMETDIKELNSVKTEIIKEKNNAIFFDKDVSSIFEELTEKLKDISENYGKMSETNFYRNLNPEKRDLIKRMNDSFSEHELNEYKMSLNEYKSGEGYGSFSINSAVLTYINEMVPELKKIRELKYEVNSVEYNEENNEYKLIQLPYSLESKEFNLSSYDEVVSFKMGVEEEKEKENVEEDEEEIVINMPKKPKSKPKTSAIKSKKTLKLSDPTKPSKAKAKTKKNKKSMDFVIVEEEEEEEEKDIQPKRLSMVIENDDEDVQIRDVVPEEERMKRNKRKLLDKLTLENATEALNSEAI
jgi:hypothetical protein